MTVNDASRSFHLRTLSNRVDRFLTQLERNRWQARERYHLVEALQHLYEGRSDEVEAALNRAEKVEPLPFAADLFGLGDRSEPARGTERNTSAARKGFRIVTR